MRSYEKSILSLKEANNSFKR